MCNKRSTVIADLGWKKVRVDPCMRDLVIRFNKQILDAKSLACCCGHGRYDGTLVIKLNTGEIRECYSWKLIPRTRNFYRKDDSGFYYIPEVSK